MTPVTWYSNEQISIESGSFGSDLVIRVQERLTMGDIKESCESTKSNLAYMLMKAQPGPTLQELARKVLY
jgi:hypothetical protein